MSFQKCAAIRLSSINLLNINVNAVSRTSVEYCRCRVNRSNQDCHWKHFYRCHHVKVPIVSVACDQRDLTVPGCIYQTPRTFSVELIRPTPVYYIYINNVDTLFTLYTQYTSVLHNINRRSSSSRTSRCRCRCPVSPSTNRHRVSLRHAHSARAP